MRPKEGPPTISSSVEGMSKKFLLDTSALLAFIEDEEGADRVEEVFEDEKALLPWPVLLEVYYVTLQERGQAEADHRYALIKQLRAEILWDMNEPIILTAGHIKTTHHVSLAAAMIAAFAIRQGAVLIHKDPEFEALATLLPMEALPYKSSVTTL